MYTITFELEGLPKPTNRLSSLHWTQKSKLNNYWYAQVISAVQDNLPAKPLLKAQLILERHSSVEPDFDGMVSSFKAVIDGLIIAKVIYNDKMSNIGQSQYRWFKTSPKKGFIRVTVTEVLLPMAQTI